MSMPVGMGDGRPWIDQWRFAPLKQVGSLGQRGGGGLDLDLVLSTVV